jgi:hypothetical protein
MTAMSFLPEDEGLEPHPERRMTQAAVRVAKVRGFISAP